MSTRRSHQGGVEEFLLLLRVNEKDEILKVEEEDEALDVDDEDDKDFSSPSTLRCLSSTSSLTRRGGELLDDVEEDEILDVFSSC